MKPKTKGHAKKVNVGNPSFPGDPPPNLGDQATSVPEMEPFDVPRSPTSAAAPFLSRGDPRGAVRGGRGSVVRPLGGGRRSRCFAGHAKNE